MLAALGCGALAIAATTRARGDEPSADASATATQGPAARGAFVIQTEPPRQPDNGLPTVPRASRLDALAAVLTVELGAVMQDVDLGPHGRDIGGAASGRVVILGSTGAVTYRAVTSGAIGGSSSGFLTRFNGDLSAGPLLALTPSLMLFARIGMDAYGSKDDALDASLYTLPAVTAGVRVVTPSATFELGPRGGLSLRSQFDPGVEADGLRRHRDSHVRPSWGATGAMVAGVALFEASLTRVEETHGLWMAEAGLCGIAGRSSSHEGFVLCGSGQYWRGATTASFGDDRDVRALALGLSVGYGFLQIKESR
jgi:hypothetical protein